MSHLIIDDAICEKLRQTTEPIELRDPRGAVLGVFEPGVSAADRAILQRISSAYLEELQRRAAEKPTGRTTADVFERLLGLTTDEETRTDLLKRIAAFRERDRCVTQ